MFCRRKRSRVSTAVVALFFVALAGACTAGGTSSTGVVPHWERSELLPIHVDEPLAAGDVRRLENCAETAFPNPWRGPWDDVANKKLAGDADPAHRTTDQVVAVGDAVIVGARMGYAEGPLAEEWVRLYVGSCDGWSQVGVRKTDAKGNVTFRLDRRLPTGVYGLVYQSTGDGTTARGQLWVLSREAEVVAFDLRGAAFQSGSEEPVVAAPALAGWHARDGRVVVYVDHRRDESSPQVSPDVWRQRLRSEGFAVGPIVDLDLILTADVDPVQPPSGWGEASERPLTNAMITTTLVTLYAADEAVFRRLEHAGTSVVDTVYGGDGEEVGDWAEQLTDLMDDAEPGDDDPG